MSSACTCNSCGWKTTAAWPLSVMRYTRPGEPAAAKMLPSRSAAMLQMYVDGVMYTWRNEGASSSTPSLRMATPFVVPFTKSS